MPKSLCDRVHGLDLDATQALGRTARFLDQIGLTLRWRKGAHGFLDRVRIRAGALEYDTSCTAADLLHEAGHLAVLPERFRMLADSNLEEAFQALGRWLDRNGGCEDGPGQRLAAAALNCGDNEATAWAWAAGVAIGLRPEQIIADDHYGGNGQWIRTALTKGRYLGIHGLAAAGWCTVPKPEVLRAHSRPGPPPYPRLARWIQIDIGE